MKDCCSIIFYDTVDDFPVKGKTCKIYIDRTNKTMYIWNGESYDQIVTTP